MQTQNNLQNAIKLQEKMAPKVITKDQSKYFQKICAVDVSYKNDTAFCSAIIYDKKQKSAIESKYSKTKSKTPYIPGLFMLKESKPIIHTLKKLKQTFDVLLIDGNGQLHPRYCGLACHIGLECDTPTVGVAKKLLCGEIKNNSVYFGGKLVGHQIKKHNKKIYISVGHKISLQSAKKLVNDLITNNNWYPEPLRIADKTAKQYRNEKF